MGVTSSSSRQEKNNLYSVTDDTCTYSFMSRSSTNQPETGFVQSLRKLEFSLAIARARELPSRAEYSLLPYEHNSSRVRIWKQLTQPLLPYEHNSSRVRICTDRSRNRVASYVICHVTIIAEQMDLSPFVVSALQAAGDESLISHDSFTALLELCLSVVINKGCDMNIDVCDIDSSKFGSCDIALLKQCYSALMTLIVEAVRVDASASSLTYVNCVDCMVIC